MKNEMVVGLVSIGVPYFDVPTAEQHLRATRALLESQFRVVSFPNIATDDAQLTQAVEMLRRENVDALVLQIGTFPNGEAPLLFAERLHVPIIVHSLPEPSMDKDVPLNSLCGANLATFTLTAINHPHYAIHGDVRDATFAARFIGAVKSATALAALKQTRLGLMGFRAPGFYPCVFDELLLRRTFGLALDHVDLSEIKTEFQTGKRKTAPVKNFPTTDGKTLPANSVAMMEQHYHALSAVLEKTGHGLIAIKDWPELFDVDAPGGIWPSLGWIQDDGILVAPEGDVNAAVTMAIDHHLTGGVPFFADVSAWNDADSTLTLWHYGGAPSLASDANTIRYGPEGREVQFTLKPGRATLTRLGLFRNAFRLVAIPVQVMPTTTTIKRAGAQVRTLHQPAGDVIRHILDNGWEHHYVLIYGDVVPEFKIISHLTHIPLSVL
jgi:L-fucose isomerase-like protein